MLTRIKAAFIREWSQPETRMDLAVLGILLTACFIIAGYKLIAG